MSKYQLSELKESDTYTIDFNLAATPKTITIREITVNTNALNGKTIAKYTYAINGVIVHESTNGEDFQLSGLTRGNKSNKCNNTRRKQRNTRKYDKTI